MIKEIKKGNMKKSLTEEEKEIIIIKVEAIIAAIEMVLNQETLITKEDITNIKNKMIETIETIEMIETIIGHIKIVPGRIKEVEMIKEEVANIKTTFKIIKQRLMINKKIKQAL